MGKRVREKPIEPLSKLINIPNPLTLIRVILSFVLIYIAFIGASLITLAIVFAIAALTDWADGFTARRYKQETRFGRKFDMFADRLLMISIIIALFIYMIVNQTLTQEKILLFILLLSREVVSIPALIISFFKKNSRGFPHARLAGKLTTALQGIAFPVIVLGWPIDILLAFITFFVGLVSAGYYWYDSIIEPSNKFQNKLDEYYNNLD
ncbi:CDP-alcohol phosphatidyltransferase family protein [Candidatus Pacearchaeota archaeon]|nr:CDP-alcohol phosphatidyltransferase family protein [Candidatus Pacearchaeota archaeon]